jgi:hypothetical protein
MEILLRTIGYNRDNSQSIGLEAKYDDELKGEVGKEWFSLFQEPSIFQSMI